MIVPTIDLIILITYERKKRTDYEVKRDEMMDFVTCCSLSMVYLRVDSIERLRAAAAT